MHPVRKALWITALFAIAPLLGEAQEQFLKGEPAPDIEAADLHNKPVDMDAIIKEGRDLVILFFFTPRSGEEMALKLATLDTRYGGRELEIIALGL